MGTLGSLKPSVLAHLLAAHRGAMFLGSLINRPDPPPRATPSFYPSPGRLAMIVTEYMENGSLDAFLRVCAPPCLPRGLGGGREVQSG